MNIDTKSMLICWGNLKYGNVWYKLIQYELRSEAETDFLFGP